MSRSATPARRILVIRRDNIGDLVLTTPLLRALRAQLPQAHIAALVTRYNEAVLEGNPDIDALYSYTKAKHRKPAESLAAIYARRLRLVLALHRTRFDLVLLPGGRQASSLRFARWLAPARVLMRDAEDQVAGPHEVEQCCHLLTRMGLAYETPELRLAPLRRELAAVSAVVEAEAANLRASAAIAPAGPAPLIALHISARKPSQRWPAERFAQLAQGLHRKLGAMLLLLWAPGAADHPLHPGDDEKAARLARMLAGDGMPAVPCCALRTDSLQQLIAALATADAVVCGDGGAMHLAAALGKPVVALFGQSEAARWRPWGPHRLLQKESRDVADIGVAEVEEAVLQLLARQGLAAPGAQALVPGAPGEEGQPRQAAAAALHPVTAAVDRS